MITADTITDEQIRELQRTVAGHAFPAAGMAHTESSEVWEACNVALGFSGLASSRCAYETEPCHGECCARCAPRKARARCAEILNARGGK